MSQPNYIRLSEVRMEAVGKRHGDAWVVKDVSISIRPLARTTESKLLRQPELQYRCSFPPVCRGLNGFPHNGQMSEGSAVMALSALAAAP